MFISNIKNLSNDKNIFECLDEKSLRHKYLSVSANDKKFQMCLRVVNMMRHGNLPDYVMGATKFHHTDVMPDWATSRGYIEEYDDLLFYL